jgi:hypothetical protein
MAIRPSEVKLRRVSQACLRKLEVLRFRIPRAGDSGFSTISKCLACPGLGLPLATVGGSRFSDCSFKTYDHDP